MRKNAIFLWKKATEGDGLAGRRSWRRINRLQPFRLESRFWAEI